MQAQTPSPSTTPRNHLLIQKKTRQTKEESLSNQSLWNSFLQACSKG